MGLVGEGARPAVPHEFNPSLHENAPNNARGGGRTGHEGAKVDQNTCQARIRTYKRGARANTGTAAAAEAQLPQLRQLAQVKQQAQVAQLARLAQQARLAQVAHLAPVARMAQT